MNYILSPIEADVQSIVSCLAYAKSISDLGVSIETARVKDIMLLWNKVDRRVKNTLMEHYSAYIKEEGLTLFPGSIYATHRFSHELEQYGFRGAFRSTDSSQPNHAECLCILSGSAFRGVGQFPILHA